MDRLKVANIEEASNLLIRGFLLYDEINLAVSEIAQIRINITKSGIEKNLALAILDMEQILEVIQQMRNENAIRITEYEVITLMQKLNNSKWMTNSLFEGKTDVVLGTKKLGEILKEVNSIETFNTSLKVLERRLDAHPIFGHSTDVVKYLLINLYYFLFYDSVLVFYDGIENSEQAEECLHTYMKEINKKE